MNYEIIISVSAERDIQSAFTWYENSRIGLGGEYVDALDEVLENISQNPEIYQLRYREVRMGIVRRFPYAIHYIMDRTKVYVLAVMHTKKEPLE